MNSRINFNGASIRQYSTTFLLLGSMSSYVYASVQETYAVHSFDQALQQSMVAEFALAYDDIPTALHNYTVLAIKATQQQLNSVH